MSQVSHERATGRNQYGAFPNSLEEAEEDFRWLEFALDVESMKAQLGESNDVLDVRERYRWAVENLIERQVIVELEDGDLTSMYDDEFDRILGSY